MKVETHNHPTAISPFPGAATGSGGEIRDEGATGRGAKPKAGLVGFSVSNLRIPGFVQPWEHDAREARPDRLARSRSCSRGRSAPRRSTTSSGGRTSPATSARSSMPVGGVVRGYHKPIMIAGGVGNIRAPHRAQERRFRRGALLVQLGGPGMLIGMGGGAASSHGRRRERRGPRLRLGAARQRRDPAPRAGGDRPLLRRSGTRTRSSRSTTSGAGGLSNALPELVHGAGRGATHRSARRAERRARHVAARDLVQRGAGALRARDRARRVSPGSARSASASAARSRWSARRPPTAGWSSTTRSSATGRSTWPWRCSSASRRRWCATCGTSRGRCRRSICAASTLEEAVLPRAARCRRSRTRPSSSRSATAPSAACARATRWSGRGRCRSPTAR